MPYEPLPASKVLGLLQNLQPLAARMILKEHGIPLTFEKDPILGLEALLHLWIADELHLQEPQRSFVLSTIVSRLPKWSHIIDQMPTELGPMLQLIFTDGKHFAYTGAEQFYDLTTGQRVTPQRPPAVSLSYNLAEIFARRHYRARHAEQHPSTAVESPG